jgi:hypothetical protein
LETIVVKSDRALSLDTTPRRGFLSNWISFWFSPIQPTGLHWLRVLCGLLFIAWLLPFAGHQTELYSLLGWFDTQAYNEMSRLPGGPPVPTGWSLVFLCGENPALLHALWWGALGVFLLFTLGMATRITSILTWLLVVSFSANPATLFSADFLLIILAFYLMIGYVLLGQWSGPATICNHVVCNRGTFLSPWSAGCSAPSYAANVTLRLVQIHFAILFMTAGLISLQSGEWWGGVALWFPIFEPFGMNAERISDLAKNREVILFFLSLTQYIVLAWHIAFPIFAWRPRWRWLLLSGGVVSWLGSIFVYGEPLLGPIYLIGCLSFLTPAEWQVLTARAGGLFQRLTGSVPARPLKKVSVRG